MTIYGWEYSDKIIQFVSVNEFEIIAYNNWNIFFHPYRAMWIHLFLKIIMPRKKLVPETPRWLSTTTYSVIQIL